MSSRCCSSRIGASRIIPALPCRYGDKDIEVVPGMSALGIRGVCGIVPHIPLAGEMFMNEWRLRKHNGWPLGSIV